MNWIPDPSHLIELLIAAITFAGIAWGFHRDDKKEQKKEALERMLAAAALEKKQDERHEENQARLRAISTELRFNPPHAHVETQGPLTARGIRYSPRDEK